jgi:hypothetical protein
MVVVEWVDSCVLDSGGWMDADDVVVNVATDAMRQESVGYLVEDNAAGVALAGSRNLSEDAVEHRNTKLGNVGTIPRAAILSIRYLGVRRSTTGRRRRPAKPEEEAK